MLEPESLDSNETLEDIGNGRYALKETYPTFIEVKVFAPTPNPDDDPDRFIIVDKYYTNFEGGLITSSKSEDESEDGDLYQIKVDGVALKLYEVDDGVPEEEDLGDKTLAPIPGTDRYKLMEEYSAFIQVKELAPVPDQEGLTNLYIEVAEYYTDFDGNRIVSPGAEDEDDIGDDGDNDSNGDDDDNTLIGYGGDDRLRGYSGEDRLYGDDDDDDLDGGDDDDVLDGGRGDDSAKGGNGDDLFIDGDDSGDDSYIGAAGVDTVGYEGALEGVSVNLLRGRSSSVDPGQGSGSDKLRTIENVIGSEFKDLIIGDSRSNDLNGRGGEDSINGLQGLDRYTGGGGKDLFVFSKASDTGLGSLADVITDFSSAEGDQIDLRAIDAKKGFTKNDGFTFVDAAPTVAGAGSNGVVWYTGGYLFASTDTDTAAEFAIKVDGLSGGILEPEDLLL